MQSEPAPTLYEHDAFISYSRKDRAFAVKLEQALENYRPPKDLDKVPQRYLDVFRDEEDFSSGEYSDELDKHLSGSKKLIVICSPNARASKYVNEEIRRFKDAKEKEGFRAAERIVSILLSGIPNNEAGPEQEEEKAFPEALVEVMKMPLAINYRGFDLSRDKVDRGIFAGSWFAVLGGIYDIYGVSRAEVEQREKKRRVRARRITYGIVGGVIAVLSIFLVFALISRSQAVTARTQAEASSLEASASQHFTQASASDLRQQILFARYRKLKSERDKLVSGTPEEGEDADEAETGTTVETRLKVLEEELRQSESDLDGLRDEARKLRSLGREELLEAGKLWRSSATLPSQAPSPPAIFSVEVLNAPQGDSLILHYGDQDDPHFILIDGGWRETYQQHLAPRLAELKDRWRRTSPLGFPAQWDPKLGIHVT